MIEKIVFLLLALLVTAGIALWQKIKAWRHPGEEPGDTDKPKPTPKPAHELLVIAQGAAGSFIVSKQYARPGSKEYKEIRDAAILYPQTRAGAVAFLTAMAKERNGNWVATALVGVSDDNPARAMRYEAIRSMRPLEEVALYSKAEDIDVDDDEAEEADADEEDQTGAAPDSENDKSYISVEYIGDRVGFLEPVLGAEIVQAKEDERARMLAFVLKITGKSDKDSGIDIGILRWEARDATDASSRK